MRVEHAKLKEAQRARDRALASADPGARKAAEEKVRAAQRELRTARAALRHERNAQDTLLERKKPASASARDRPRTERAKTRADRETALREPQAIRKSQGDAQAPADSARTRAREDALAEQERRRLAREEAVAEARAQREALKPLKEEQRRVREQKRVADVERRRTRDARRNAQPAAPPSKPTDSLPGVPLAPPLSQSP